MTRRSLYIISGIIGLLAAGMEPCAAGSLGDTPASPYEQPLAAIGYNLDSPVAVTDKHISATDISAKFSAWRNTQRPSTGQVYAVVKQTPRGWMLSSLSPSRPGASELPEERIVSAGNGNTQTDDLQVSLAAVPQD